MTRMQPLARPRPPAAAGAGEWSALAAVLLAAAWLHRGALRAPFFADDYLFLDRVTGRSLWQALLAPDPIGNYLRPLGRALWFWTLSALSGGAPGAFHAANLGLFLVGVVLLWGLVRQALGPRAALIAAALLALQHAADVPVLWASGSQDLLAVCLALAALRLFVAGRRFVAALCFLLALLAKEVVVLTPLIAAALDRKAGERWSRPLARAWPLFAALAVWGCVLLSWSLGHPLLGMKPHVGPAELLATPLHLLQTVLGIEWSQAGWTPRLPSAAVALLALVVAWQGRLFRERSTGAGETVLPGALWACLGAVPVVAVAGIWSAYYFLFAACGAAWALAAVARRWPWWTPAALVAVLGWSCENAGGLPEFATANDPWTTCSHVNRRYLERGMFTSGRYLEDLRRARPTLPRRSTLFFSQFPAKVAFQTADGPLVRWAYRDTSLRSYFLTRFRLEDARRGPVFFFQASHDSLHEVQGPDSLERIGLGLLLSGAPEAARDLWRLEHERDPASTRTAYRLAWVELRLSRPDSARAWLVRSGAAPDAGSAPETRAAYQQVTAGDTARAIEIAGSGALGHALDPGIHAILADLLLVHQGVSDGAVIESYATWVLAPQEASSWRRWGMVSYLRGRQPEARDALERYFALGGPAARNDAEAVRILADIRRRLPGGALAQQAVRGEE